MYGTDRARLRDVFFQAWRRHRTGQPVGGIERMVVDVALRHPEYQRLLEDPDAHADRDFDPAFGQTNPFLHLGMHIAIEEQLSIDQPRGVRAHYDRLRLRLADEHTAQHVMMECLGEMLWQAQSTGADPNEAVYLECLGKADGSAK
jgi:hypothetical protein